MTDAGDVPADDVVQPVNRPDEATSDNPDNTGPDKTTLTTHDKPDQSSSCNPAVDTDCSVDLTKSSVVTSEAGHSHFSDNVQGLRTRYGRVVRPVRLIEHMHQKVVAGH